MNPSLKLKTVQSTKTGHQKDSPKIQKTQSNYLISSKSKSQKLKTTGYRNDSIRLNNSINYLQENTTTFHSSLSIPYNTDETSNKNEIRIKQQLIIQLKKKISQLETQNSVLEESNKQMQNDSLLLNKTIEQICNQLSKQKEKSENLTTQISELQNTLSLQKQEISQQKNENFKLMTVLKLSKQKYGKENCAESIQHNYQEQINLLKEQISFQKQSFQQTEWTLQREINSLTSFFNKFFFSMNNLNDQNNSKAFSQNETNLFQLQFQNLDDELETETYDSKFMYCQQTLNNQIEKQVNSVVESTNLNKTKEILKLKQIIQIQKKQIELQQKTILNQHQEIQNLQTLLYKSENESIAELKRNSVNTNDQFGTQEFANSPHDEMCYHLNDSQSDIKPKCFLDTIQSTLQKFQIITEENTFRN